jgi:hypothetical protein
MLLLFAIKPPPLPANATIFGATGGGRALAPNICEAGGGGGGSSRGGDTSRANGDLLN